MLGKLAAEFLFADGELSIEASGKKCAVEGLPDFAERPNLETGESVMLRSESVSQAAVTNTNDDCVRLKISNKNGIVIYCSCCKRCNSS